MHSKYAEAFEVIKIGNDTNLFARKLRPVIDQNAVALEQEESALC
jgi:hypothetical protein